MLKKCDDLCFIQVNIYWKEKPNISHFVQFFVVFEIENNISDVYVTNAECIIRMATREIRDPIYKFIHINPYEKELIDTDYFRRLRYIHQLGLTHYVYPGAEHNRFEHSLGTMEIATKAFDILKEKKFGTKNLFTELYGSEIEKYKQILRIACLLHDIGHYPFSHSSEEVWGKDHEEMGKEIILSEDFKKKIEDKKLSGFDIKAEDIAFIITECSDIGKYDAKLRILKEILTGDLGVDRVDYLIRDSYHTGVSYGVFDCHRLIDTLILCENFEGDPCLGVEAGGVRAAEGLILARYFMFTQVYFHKTRVAYDLHLRDYLKEFLCYWNEKKVDYKDFNKFLDLTDFSITHHICEDSKKTDKNKKVDLAKIIMNREHHELAGSIIGSNIGLMRLSGGKEPKEISKMIFKETDEKIKAKYQNEVDKGDVLCHSNLKDTNKFEKTAFSVYADGEVKNILYHSEIIGNLKSMDTLLVYTIRGNTDLKLGVGHIIKDIKKKYDIW